MSCTHGAYGTPLVGCVICSQEREREKFINELPKMREQLRQAQERAAFNEERWAVAIARADRAEQERNTAVKIIEETAQFLNAVGFKINDNEQMLQAINELSDERDALKAQVVKAVELVLHEIIKTYAECDVVYCTCCHSVNEDGNKIAIQHRAGCNIGKLLADPTAQSTVAEWQAMREVCEAVTACYKLENGSCGRLLDALARLDAVRKGE